MKSSAGRIFWGVVLILAGGYFLAEQFGIAPELTDTGWSVFLGVLSVGFFALYAGSRMRDWGLLFPACILGGAAATTWLANNYEGGSLPGAVMMWSIALPFWGAWLSDRKKNWWATIPGWALAVIGAIVQFEETIGGDMVGVLVLWSIALPFLVVYLRSRAHWWPLIPAGVLGLVGFIVLLDAFGSADEAIGGVFLAGLGLVFLFVYSINQANWWAVIPGGIMLSLSIAVFISLVQIPQPWDERLMDLIAFGGMGLTFLLLWFWRDRYGTTWAKYPGVGLIIFAVLAAAFSQERAWPFALIVVGFWLLLRRRSDMIDEVVKGTDQG